MPQAIARMYGSQETASTAVKELQDHGFSADAIHVVGRPEAQETVSTGTEASADPVMEAVLKTGVAPAHAKIYAERVHRGEVLVVVYPPFGYARTAIQILQNHDPIVVEVPEVEAEPRAAVAWDNAAPLSSALGLRVLLSDPTPLSNWLKRPTLKREPETSNTLEKIRKQSRDATPLSSKLGAPVLFDNAAPLSARFGWQVLLEKAAPLSERFGWRVLLDNPTPLSSKFGWRVLLDNPTPLSSKFGWRVLSDDPAPLSSAAGLPVRSKD